MLWECAAGCFSEKWLSGSASASLWYFFIVVNFKPLVWNLLVWTLVWIPENTTSTSYLLKICTIKIYNVLSKMKYGILQDKIWETVFLLNFLLYLTEEKKEIMFSCCFFFYSTVSFLVLISFCHFSNVYVKWILKHQKQILIQTILILYGYFTFIRRVTKDFSRLLLNNRLKFMIEKERYCHIKVMRGGIRPSDDSWRVYFLIFTL